MTAPSMSEVVRSMEGWVNSFAVSSEDPRRRAEARGWAWLASYAAERASDALLPPDGPPRPAESEPGRNP